MLKLTRELPTERRYRLVLLREPRPREVRLQAASQGDASSGGAVQLRQHHSWAGLDGERL